MSKKHNSYSFDFNEVILFLYKNWKRLFIISFSAGVLGLVFSSPWFVTPKYKSVCVFYPGTVNSISTALFYSNKTKAQDPLMYAEQEVTEHYLQLLASDDLAGRVIGKFKLYEHYGLDPNNMKDQHKMGKIYEENILINRTDFNSIKVVVMDPSPEMAAELANGIVDLMDHMKTEVQHNVAQQIYTIVEKEYVAKLNYTDSIKNRLKELGAEGVYDLTNQAKGISEIVGKGSNNAFTEKEKAKLGEHGGEVFLLITMLELEAENLTLLRTKYEQAKVDLAGNLSNVFIISKGAVANTKAYPRRLLVIIISALAAFVMGCITIIGYDKYNEFRELIKP